MIEVPLARREGGRDRAHPGVAGVARGIHLPGREGPRADEPQPVRLDATLLGSLIRRHVLMGGPVAGLAVDARLGPRRVVRVGAQIVVPGQLTDVATVAGRVERIQWVRPMHRRIGLGAGEMPDPAGGRVEPSPLVDIVGQRQGLEPSFSVGGQEVVYVLAAEDMGDPMSLPAGRAPLPHIPFVGADERAIAGRAYVDLVLVGRQIRPGELGRVGLHRQSMMRRGPQLIERLVALPATARSGVSIRRSRRGTREGEPGA